jgi:hypothetical protein
VVAGRGIAIAGFEKPSCKPEPRFASDDVPVLNNRRTGTSGCPPD